MMRKDKTRNLPPNFFDAPLRIRVPGGNPFLIKADKLFCGAGLLAMGGWASEPLEVSFEAAGEDIPLLKATSHFRRDVNLALEKKDDLSRAFAVIAELPENLENLFLVCANRDLDIRFKLPFSLEKASAGDDPAFEGVFGPEIHEIIRRAIRKFEAQNFSLDGQIDTALRLLAPGYDNAMILAGWLSLPKGAELYASERDARSKNALRPWFWHRADIERGKGPNANPDQSGYGFMVAVSSGSTANPMAELWSEDKGKPKKLALKAIEDVASYREFLNGLFNIPIPWNEFSDCCKSILLPVLSGLQKQHAEILSKRPAMRGQFGKIPAHPKVSVIIPLFGNLKFLFNQLMCFSEDPCFQEEAELIYVLDDASLLDDFRTRGDELQQLFGVPFLWICNGSNQGFSLANNLGASIARGDILVFMNSDVFPQNPGWLKEFRAHLENNPATGIAGCQLLQPSGVIQHRGMNFKRNASLKIWTNCHPNYGCDPDLLDSKVQEAPAVTGACLAVGKKFFEELGGWNTQYVVGDFEDSDLCLRAHKAGKKVVILPYISLIHLERQSFALLGNESMRQRMTIYNAVCHQEKWQKDIEKQASTPGNA